MYAVFDRRNIRWPLEIVVRPAVDTDPAVLERLVRCLSADHAQFIAVCDRESALILVGGCDECQLEKNLTLLRSKVLSDLHVDPPQVGFREAISQAAEVDYSHRKRTGRSSQFARVKFVIEPRDVRFDFEFENKAVRSAVPKEFIPGVERGVQSVLDRGVFSGFPMIGLKISLVDGAYDDVDSSMMAFEIASRAAIREAALKAAPVLLEPILKVAVVTPEEYMGDVIADLNSRRGLISGTDSRDSTTTINAYVPVAGMFGYRNTLAEMARGRASFSVQFSHYERTPSL